LECSEILAYNTDSVKIRGPFNESVVKSKSECELGEYHMEGKVYLNGLSMEELVRNPEYIHTVEECVTVKEEDMDKRRIVEKGGLIVGMPGCGKTELIVEMLKGMDSEEKEKTVVVAYTNASAENLKNRGVEAHTLSSLLWNGKSLRIDALASYKRLILDEFTMLPPVEMSLLLHAKHKYGLIVICVGDPDQCNAPVENFVRYEKNPLFLSMCGNYVVTLKYKEGFSRYDKELYEVLVSFKDSKKLVWKCDEIKSYTNLCYSNDMRHMVNERCFKRWIEEKDVM
jgi:hypothetical protein